MSTETIIRSTSLEVSVGLELLDHSENVLADISDNLIGGEVSRNNLATIHGTASFSIAEEYSWHAVRLRPYITLTDLENGESQTWGMGVFLPNTPERRGGTYPLIFDIEAYDKLVLLDTPHGQSYSVNTSDFYLGAVEALLDTVGETYSFDQTKASTALISEMTWSLDDKNTTLRIINDLLAAVGYKGLYADRNGVFRSEPYTSPSTDNILFDYSTAHAETVLLDDYSASSDLFDIPNRWVFINDNPTQAVPSEGAGIYTVANQSDGDSSIDSRGRIITRIVRLDAADQTSLVTQGDRIAEADRQPLTILDFRSSPNPDHWHRAVITVDAAEVGIASGTRFIENEWSQPLGPYPMTHRARKVAA